MPGKPVRPRYVQLVVRYLRVDYDILAGRARAEGYLSTASFIRSLLAPVLAAAKRPPSAPPGK